MQASRKLVIITENQSQSLNKMPGLCDNLIYRNEYRNPTKFFKNSF